MSDEFEIPESLLSHAKGHDIVVLAGAGVSAGPPSSLPDWNTLNHMIVSALSQRIETYLDRPGYTHDVRVAIDERRIANLFPPDYQSQILEESCGDHYFKALQAIDVDVRNSTHDLIAWLAKHNILSAVVTTNFDRLLERAFDAHNIPYEVAYEPKTYERCLSTLQRGSSDSPLQLLKVHGCVQDHHSLVDTLKQRLLGRNKHLEHCLSQLFGEHLVLCVGFSAADLETDDNYLQLLPSARRSPGLVYVQWPGSKDLSKGAQKLFSAYNGKASKVVVELDPFFRSICRDFRLPELPMMPSDPNARTRAQVEKALASWATELHPAAAINCLTGLVEANGETNAAFQLLHRFWKDVASRDRNGPDFELYRLRHGRLGIGGGILSLVEDLETTAGTESIQNLLRRGNADDPRALAWAGLAWLWAGQTEKAQTYLSTASRSIERNKFSLEEKVDVWLAEAEALYILGEPEGIFATWERATHMAKQAGDLPRHAILLAVVSLYYAEFMPDTYQNFIQEHVKSVFTSAKRLNNPLVTGFTSLAQGRYLTKQQEGTAAIKALDIALNSFSGAGRPPWQIFASIEYSKALFDQKKVEDAADMLNAINQYVDRYQVWLIWLEEAKGQLYTSLGRNDEARHAFEQAVSYATQMGLNRRAKTLQKYLNYLI